MLRTNVHKISDTLDFLAELGVPTIGLNALIYAGQGLTVGTGLHERELQPILDMAVRKTSEHNQRLIWYTPTQYCNFDPTQSNLGVKGCTASLYSMCIEFEWERAAMSILLPSTRQHAHRSLGVYLEPQAVGAVARAPRTARKMRWLSHCL